MVIDTSIFIDHLRAKDKHTTTLYLLPENPEIYISTVTLYELYMGATTKEKENDIKILTEDLIKLDFTKEIASKSAFLYHFLRKKNKMIEFRDIFIAATCIVNDLPLLTHNRKHFIRIEGLKLI
ncbi:type II toxin-antitoxin system VapC family toxin [Pseudopedobacter beijingensis]|uniref:Ribonuclease VapC n=1 Tax=Pseudopedobacter beijingensis TaxID=1207056 RepID=A0ABW4I9C2_9SPHI